MGRFHFIHSLMLRKLFLCLLFLVKNAHASVQRPNIVFIFADDMGYGDVKALNPSGKIKTPYIDTLAKEGISFLDAHSTSSVCTPSRYGLLTGRYNWRSHLQGGVLANEILTSKHGTQLITKDRMTLGTLLQKEGYKTAIFGKWHLGFQFDLSSNSKQTSRRTPQRKSKRSTGFPIGTKIIGGPTDLGFDYYYGFHHAQIMRTLYENNKIIEEIDEIKVLPRLQEKVITYIHDYAKTNKNDLKNDNREKNDQDISPFFIYMALSSPHTPVVPSKEFQNKLCPVGSYGNFVIQTDSVVGNVSNTLIKNKLDKNTILIFSSDNGASLADRTIKDFKHYSSNKYRGSKADLWDGGHRIPFILKWPNNHNIIPNSQSNQLICLVDIMATFADILNIKLPNNQGEDSHSFSPLLNISPDYQLTPQLNRNGIIHHSFDGLFAYRTEQYKLLLCPGSGGWTHPKDNDARLAGQPLLQLYDMSSDPTEKHNLIMSKPEIAIQLFGFLLKDIKNGRTRPLSSISESQESYTSHKKKKKKEEEEEEENDFISKNEVPVDIWKGLTQWITTSDLFETVYRHPYKPGVSLLL